jgi:hypothetical protein
VDARCGRLQRQEKPPSCTQERTQTRLVPMFCSPHLATRRSPPRSPSLSIRVVCQNTLSFAHALFPSSRLIYTAAMKLAADIVEHRGPGQRRNRNRLAFLAPDQAALEDIQSVVRKKLAWASIDRDAAGPGTCSRPASARRSASRCWAPTLARWRSLLAVQREP